MRIRSGPFYVCNDVDVYLKQIVLFLKIWLHFGSRQISANILKRQQFDSS